MFGLQSADPHHTVEGAWADDDTLSDDADILSFSVPPGYHYLQDLGTGAFGEVVLAESPQWGQVALKRTFDLDLELGAGHRLAGDCAEEAAALQAAAGHNVVQLYDVVKQGKEHVLVLEHCATDLEKLLGRAKRPLPWPLAIAIFKQLVQAVVSCHTAGVMHRDIKPGNILLTQPGKVKLADFGHARWMACKLPCSPAVASRWYRAPELLYGSCKYGAAVDMWALGCVLAELLGEGPLFPGSSDIDQLCRLRSVLGSIDAQAWPAALELPDFGKLSFGPAPAVPLAKVLPKPPAAALDLLQALLQYNPDHRPSAPALLQHFLLQQHATSEQDIARLVEQTLEQRPQALSSWPNQQ